MTGNTRRPLFLVALGHVILEVCNNGLPVVYPLLVAAGLMTFTQVGLVTLVASLSASLSQPLMGYLSDRWDPRLMVAGSIALSGLCMGLVGSAPGLGLFLLLVALAMLGSAAFHPAGATLSSASSLSGRRGAALAIFSVGGNVGAALSPLWMTVGLSWFGLRGTAVVIPVGLLGSLLLWQQLRTVPLTTRHQATGAAAAARKGSLAGLTVIVLAVMFRTWFQISLTTYLPSWVAGQTGSLEAGAQMLFGMMVATAFGSLVGGTLSDRTGRWPLMAVSLGLLVPITLLLGRAPASIRPFQVAALGFLVGSTFPVAIVAAQETWPAGHGMASGLTMGLTWAGGGLGALVTGAVADSYSLGVALQWLWVPALLSAVCILAYPLAVRRTGAGPADRQRSDAPTQGTRVD